MAWDLLGYMPTKMGTQRTNLQPSKRDGTRPHINPSAEALAGIRCTSVLYNRSKGTRIGTVAALNGHDGNASTGPGSHEDLCASSSTLGRTCTLAPSRVCGPPPSIQPLNSPRGETIDMIMALLSLPGLLFLVLLAPKHTASLDNGVGWLPIRGWSSWNTFQYNVSEALLIQAAHHMAGKLKSAGYTYVLLDDGWTACSLGGGLQRCRTAAPRDREGRIPVDKAKFPRGFKPVTDAIHDLGLKVGIYTSVSATTCGGYLGSLGHEAVDAQAFADWGEFLSPPLPLPPSFHPPPSLRPSPPPPPVVRPSPSPILCVRLTTRGVTAGFDFVKHDTCGTDCSIHNGCIQRATARMRDGLYVVSLPGHLHRCTSAASRATVFRTKADPGHHPLHPEPALPCGSEHAPR